MSTKDLQDLINKNRAELDAARTELEKCTLNPQEHCLRELEADLYEAKQAAGIPVSTAPMDTGNVRVYQWDFDLFTKVLTDVYRDVRDYRQTPSYLANTPEGHTMVSSTAPPPANTPIATGELTQTTLSTTDVSMTDPVITTEDVLQELPFMGSATLT
jgi:hypothetical protein